jgi:hypothetical protein
MTTPISNVCSLEAGELAGRAKQWSALRERALQRATRTEAGARFEYVRSKDVENELEALVRAERECCAVGDVGWRLEKTDDTLAVCVDTPAGLAGSREAALIFSVIGGGE